MRTRKSSRKLAIIKAKYAYWNKHRNRLSRRCTSDCEQCSSSSGDGCHGDGSCGGDGD
jgi:hypothetical protein